MRVGMLLDNVFPPDDRVAKEAMALINNGHQVFLLCYRDNNQPFNEIWKNINIQRTKLNFKTGKKLLGLIFILPVFKYYWYFKIKKFVLKNQIDILHVHDLPLCKPAYLVKDNLKIKLICDMHEDFADWILNTPLYTKGLKRYLKYFQNWKGYEKDCLQHCDLVIGVSEPLVNKIITNYQLNKNQVINIPNTPDLSIFNIQKTDFSLQSEMEQYYNVIYSGMIDELRGLQYIIPLIDKIIQHIPNFRLLIVGSGKYENNLKELAVKYKVEKYVHFSGFQTIENVAAYIALSKIGIYPQKKYKGIDETIPTKLFQYCAMGIPVISSNHLLPREFINQFNCGFLINFEESSEQFIEKVIYLHSNELKRQEMGINGKQAVMNHYNWDLTIKPLISYYSSL